MNCYILTEDSESLLKVLPEWLRYMRFPCERVLDISSVKENNYVLQSGHGIIQLITCALFQTFDTIIESDNIIDDLILILDAEEMTPEERFDDVMLKIESYERKSELKCNIHIFVANCCFESWLLCNSSLYPNTSPNVNSPFYVFYNFYDIKNNDPEKMNKPPIPFKNVGKTKAKFHFAYFHAMCRYNGKVYRKGNTKFVEKQEFFDNLVSRINRTSHGNSFRAFYEYVKEMST